MCSFFNASFSQRIIVGEGEPFDTICVHLEAEDLFTFAVTSKELEEESEEHIV